MHRERDRITRRYSAEQTHTEFTYGDFPYHLKANRSKLALINRLWKCRKGEGLTITTHSFTKIDQLDGFCLLWRSDLKIPSAPGTNQIAGFVEFRPLTSRKKDKSSYAAIKLPIVLSPIRSHPDGLVLQAFPQSITSKTFGRILLTATYLDSIRPKSCFQSS